MNKQFYIVILFFLILTNLYANEQDSVISDTAYTQVEQAPEQYSVKPVDSTLMADLNLEPKQKYSLAKSALLSTFIPGSGQFYAGRKSRGVVFLLSEAAIGAFALVKRDSWHDDIVDYKNAKPDIATYRKLLFHYKLLGDTENTQKYFKMYKDTYQDYYIKKYDALDAKFQYYTTVGWGVGIHLTNIMDAITSSRHFYSEKYKKPGLAAGLSAIPVLGLGQIYNGSFQKAGLLWTTQFMLLYMGINYGRLAETALVKRDNVEIDLSLTDTLRVTYKAAWVRKYNDALKDRNTYLWYFVLFYFYGIFDAAVDAHLHDKALKIRLHPAADPVAKSASLNLTLNIKAKNKNGNYTKRYR